MSICPVCNKKVSVKIVNEENRIYSVKTCPEHGVFKSIVWYGEPSYEEWVQCGDNTRPYRINTKEEAGCPYDCGICPNHEQEACCVLIELTQRCNQSCPYCFADSSHTTSDAQEEPTLEEIRGIYAFLLEQSSDRPFNIQLSGGEPTIRDDLPQIIAMGREMGFPYIQLNTNGRKLAESWEYTKVLKKAGLSSAFLQFDGLTDDVYLKTRGRELLDNKMRAIANCAKEELGTILVVTVVPGINDDQVGSIIRFALQHRPYVRGIHFQPVSYFGRFPAPPADQDRITIPELIRAIEEQTEGEINREALVPLSTGHPLCSFHGNFLIDENGGLIPLSDRNKAENNNCCCKTSPIVQARDYIARKWSWDNPADPFRTEGERDHHSSDEFSQWDSLIRQLKENSFSLTAMAFQDVWNLDLERLKRCRVHVATKDRKLIPFCSYNILYRSREK